MKRAEYEAAMQKSRAIADEITRCDREIRQLEIEVQDLVRQYMAAPAPICAKMFGEIEEDNSPDSVGVSGVPPESLAAALVRGEWSGNGCPECGVIMIFQEGCLTCQSCGYSKCG